MGIPPDTSVKSWSSWEMTFIFLLGYSLLVYPILWLTGATLPGQWELVQLLSRVTAFVLLLPQATHSYCQLRHLISQGTTSTS